MKKLVSLALAVMLVVLANTSISAQTRISFKRGSSSATRTGTIGVNRGVAGANYRSYVLRARAGQTISATVSSRNGKVYFTDNDETSYSVYTDSAGDYVLRIYNGGANSTNYTLTVSIQ